MTYTRRNQHTPEIELGNLYMDLTAQLLGIRDNCTTARVHAYQGTNDHQIFIEMTEAVNLIDRIRENELAQLREWQARLDAAAKE